MAITNQRALSHRLTTRRAGTEGKHPPPKISRTEINPVLNKGVVPGFYSSLPGTSPFSALITGPLAWLPSAGRVNEVQI